MSKVKAEDLIRQYIKTIIGVDCIDVEIVEDTVVLSREDRWHIYAIPGRFTFIGCYVDEDVDLLGKLRKYAPEIDHIYRSHKEGDETVSE